MADGSSGKIEFNPQTMHAPDVYKIVAGCIVPRPIAFISTVSREGINNAAPFSFFNGISHIPPMVCVSISSVYAQNRPKDTLTNIVETGEFVVNIVNEDIAEAQDACSETWPSDYDEIAGAGLTATASKMVRAPRIEESPVNFECRLFQSIPLPRSPYTLVIGEIVCMHVRSDLVLPNGRISAASLRAIGRMTGNSYVGTDHLFTLSHDALEVVSAKK